MFAARLECKRDEKRQGAAFRLASPYHNTATFVALP